MSAEKVLNLNARKRRVRISPVGFFCAALVFALSLLLSTNVFAERLPIKIYTSADGLGSSFVNSIAADSRGFLWFSTRDGLSRFDGREFTTYKIGAGEAPPGIEQIYEAETGVYWITTTGGTYRFDSNRLKDQGIGNPKIKVLDADFITPQRGALYKDSQGHFWFGGDALYLIEEKNGGFALKQIPIRYPDAVWSKYPIFDVYETADNSLWLTTKYGLIRRLPDERAVFYRFDESDKINDSAADAAGRIWIVSNDSVDVFMPESVGDFPVGEQVFSRNLKIESSKVSGANSVLPDAKNQIVRLAATKDSGATFRQIYQSADGHLWVTAGEFLLEYDGRDFKKYDAARGIVAPVASIAEDGDGNLWFGGANGATRLKRFGLTAFAQNDGLNSVVIQSLYQRGNEFYAVNGDAAISRFDGANFETVRLKIDKNSAFAWFSNVAFLDSRGEWWVLTEEKLYRFAAPASFADLANQTPKTYTKADGLKGNFLFRIFEDSLGDLWISTHDRETANIGLTRWTRRDEKFRAFDENDGFPKNKAPASFAEQADGTLWFGFYEDGLIRYKNGEFSEITESLPKGFFTAIYFDRQNRLWLASSSSGVTRFDDPNDLKTISARYTVENGLSSDNVRSLVGAPDGEIYVGTARGVDRISPDANRIRHFSASDGLQGDFVNAAAIDQRGALWFGTPNGLSRFLPQREKIETAPDVWINNLRVAGENRFVPPLGTGEISDLELAANQNNLQVDFFAVDFGAEETLRYQYKLEGADADWSAPTNQRTVNYANLAAGNYRLLIRSVKANGATSDEAATVSLNVLAPFYRRWWFVAAAALVIGGGMFALDRYRVKKTSEVRDALDISQRSEQAAVLSESRYRTLAETASDAIITIDEASRIVYVNQAAEKVFGFSPAELLGKSITDLMPENFRGEHLHGFKRYLTTNRKQLVWAAIELPGKHKSGALIPLELSFGEFEFGGKRFFTGIARDVSERKRHEAALEKARAERLAELERVRSRIARDLHDDVGSSLTQIALFSEIAKQNLNGGNQEPLEFLVQTSNELVEAMSDIVWAINPAKDRFADLTQRMRRFASETLTAADIDLEFTAPETAVDAPLGANLRREIFLIFKESINNIVKHSNAKSVAVNFSAVNNYLSLTVADDGDGFETIERSTNDYDWRAAKNGNGLPGMKRRAADLGGDFSIESKKNVGTKIVLRVPLDISFEITVSPD